MGSSLLAAGRLCPVFSSVVSIAFTSIIIMPEMSEERSGSDVSGIEAPYFSRIIVAPPLAV